MVSFDIIFHTTFENCLWNTCSTRAVYQGGVRGPNNEYHDTKASIPIKKMSKRHVVVFDSIVVSG
jgi:hypothetical protein